MNIMDDVKDNENKVIMKLIVFSISMLCLYPLTEIYGNLKEDIIYYLNSGVDFNVLQMIKKSFLDTGMFSYSFSVITDLIPHFLKLKFPEYGELIYQVLKLLMIFLGVYFTSLMIKRITNSNMFSWYFMGSFFLLLQNMVYPDPINSKEVSVHLSLIFFSLSMILFLKFLDSDKGGIYISSSLFFFFITVISSESFLLFIFTFIFISFTHFFFNFRYSNFAKKFIYPNLGIFLISTLVVVVFYFVKYKLGGQISSEESNFTYWKNLAFKDIYIQNTISGIPAYNFINWALPINKAIIDISFKGSSVFNGGLVQILKVIELKWIIKALLGVLLICIILPKVKIRNYSMIMLSGLGISFIIFPNLIASLSEKYVNNFKGEDLINSEFTYYNQIGWILISCLLTLEFFRISNFISKITGGLMLFIISIIISIISIGTDFWNSSINSFESIHASKWKMVDEVVNSKSFEKIRSNSNVLVNTLYKSQYIENLDMIQGKLGDKYWQKYFDIFTNKKLKVEIDPIIFENNFKDELNMDNYSIIFRSEKSQENSYIIFSEVIGIEAEKNYINIQSSDSTVLHHSNNRVFSLQGKYIKNSRGSISIDNSLELYNKDGFFFSKLVQIDKSTPLKIKCNGCRYDPGSISISYYPGIEESFPKMIISDPEFDRAFYKQESGKFDKKDLINSVWRWAKYKKDAKIIINNRTTKSAIAKIDMELHSKSSGKLLIDFNSYSQVIDEIKNYNSPIILKNQEVLLTPGRNIIKVTSSLKNFKLKDGRSVNYAIVNFNIRYKFID